EGLERRDDDCLADAAEGLAQLAHAAIEGRPVAAAMEVARALIGADIVRRFGFDLSVALAAILVCGCRQRIARRRERGMPFHRPVPEARRGVGLELLPPPPPAPP